MSRPRRARRQASLACAIALVLLGGCSSGGGATNAAATERSTASQSSSVPARDRGSNSNASSTAASDLTAESGAADGSCPLTAEQVSTLLGVPMQRSDTAPCYFERADHELFPSASYNSQHPVVFDELEDLGYTEAVDGLGDRAYIAEQADGVWVLVQSGDHIFEVRVDSNDAAADRESAKKLAQAVIDNLDKG